VKRARTVRDPAADLTIVAGGSRVAAPAIRSGPLGQVIDRAGTTPSDLVGIWSGCRMASSTPSFVRWNVCRAQSAPVDSEAGDVLGRGCHEALGPLFAVAPIHSRRSTVLVIKLIGVAVFVALVVRWKRLRLPLLLVVLVAVLYYMLCNSSAPVKPPQLLAPPAVNSPQNNAPIRPYETVCPHPETSCNEPGVIRDGGPGLLPDVAPATAE
jgi:hypothetical protein